MSEDGCEEVRAYSMVRRTLCAFARVKGASA